jgi:hypothetical protein
VVSLVLLLYCCCCCHSVLCCVNSHAGCQSVVVPVGHCSALCSCRHPRYAFNTCAKWGKGGARRGGAWEGGTLSEWVMFSRSNCMGRGDRSEEHCGALRICCHPRHVHVCVCGGGDSTMCWCV